MGCSTRATRALRHQGWDRPSSMPWSIGRSPPMHDPPVLASIARDSEVANGVRLCPQPLLELQGHGPRRHGHPVKFVAVQSGRHGDERGFAWVITGPLRSRLRCAPVNCSSPCHYLRAPAAIWCSNKMDRIVYERMAAHDTTTGGIARTANPFRLSEALCAIPDAHPSEDRRHRTTCRCWPSSARSTRSDRRDRRRQGERAAGQRSGHPRARRLTRSGS